jgi:chromosome segregation ATPase
LWSSLKSLQNEKKVLEGLKGKVEKESKRNLRKVQELEDRVRDLSDHLSQSQERIQEMQTKVLAFKDSHSTTCKRLENELEDWTRKIQALETQKELKWQERQALRDRVNEIHDDLTLMRKNLREARLKYLALQKPLDQDENGQDEGEGSGIKTVVQELDQETRQLEAQLKELTLLKVQLMSKISTLKNKKGV